MNTIRIGQIALSFHRASAAYVADIITRQGYEITIQEASHEDAFNMLAGNQIDLLISAWLPGSHGKYLANYENDIVKLGIIYNPYCIWGVPDYIDEKIVSTVADLNKPEVLARFDKEIFCINPGAGISRFSLEIIDKYQLKDNGYTLTFLPENDYFSYIEKSIAAKKFFIIPFWHPQFLHYKYKLRELIEPFGLLRGKDAATLLIRKDALSKLDGKTLEKLKKIYLGNDNISALDYLLHVEQHTIEESLKIIGELKDGPDVNYPSEDHSSN
jgi:glycine betaine/proline transport system substrate-binding protein